jgi:hypothetical protein
MNEPPRVLLGKSNAFVSIGFAIVIGSALFMLGTIFNEVKHLSGLNIGTRLATMEANMQILLDRKRVTEAFSAFEHANGKIPYRSPGNPGDQSPYIDWQIGHTTP